MRARHVRPFTPSTPRRPLRLSCKINGRLRVRPSANALVVACRLFELSSSIAIAVRSTTASYHPPCLSRASRRISAKTTLVALAFARKI